MMRYVSRSLGKHRPETKGSPLVAHNSPFDEGCLKAAHEVYDLAIRNIPSIALAVYPGRCTHFW